EAARRAGSAGRGRVRPPRSRTSGGTARSRRGSRGSRDRRSRRRKRARRDSPTAPARSWRRDPRGGRDDERLPPGHFPADVVGVGALEADLVEGLAQKLDHRAELLGGDAEPRMGALQRLVAERRGAAHERGDELRLMVDEPLRSEEHTSELQSRENIVCRLLLEKKKRPTLPAAA